MMTLKFVYNLIDAILLCYNAALPYLYDFDQLLFSKLNVFNLSLDRIPSTPSLATAHSYGVCHLYENTTQTEEKIWRIINQTTTVISKADNLTVQIPTIGFLLVLSSHEIIFFVCCRNTWNQFLFW